MHPREKRCRVVKAEKCWPLSLVVGGCWRLSLVALRTHRQHPAYSTSQAQGPQPTITSTAHLEPRPLRLTTHAPPRACMRKAFSSLHRIAARPNEHVRCCSALHPPCSSNTPRHSCSVAPPVKVHVTEKQPYFPENPRRLLADVSCADSLPSGRLLAPSPMHYHNPLLHSSLASTILHILYAEPYPGTNR